MVPGHASGLVQSRFQKRIMDDESLTNGIDNGTDLTCWPTTGDFCKHIVLSLCLNDFEGVEKIQTVLQLREYIVDGFPID